MKPELKTLWFQYDFSKVNVCYQENRVRLNMHTQKNYTKVTYRRARENVHNMLGELAREGDQLGQIETGYKIADAARDLFHSRPQPEVNAGFIPGPEIRVEEGSLDFKIKPRGMFVDYVF